MFYDVVHTEKVEDQMTARVEKRVREIMATKKDKGKEYESLNTETEMGQGIARSFRRDDSKNFNILKHNPLSKKKLSSRKFQS